MYKRIPSLAICLLGLAMLSSYCKAELLTQSERELVYAVRDFEVFREGFSIGVARTYFDLQSQRKTLANQDANYQAAVFEYHQENDRDGNNPDGIPWRNFRVQLELLGDQYIAARNLGYR